MTSAKSLSIRRRGVRASSTPSMDSRVGIDALRCRSMAVRGVLACFAMGMFRIILTNSRGCHGRVVRASEKQRRVST